MTLINHDSIPFTRSNFLIHYMGVVSELFTFAA
jgi:hypothetical protein